jgi:hypothetical protein
MTPEQLEKITKECTKLLRAHFQLQAEVKTLASIIQIFVQVNEPPPANWLDLLRAARETPAYRSISEQFAPQLAQLEAVADWSELNRLLGAIPPAQFVN